MAGFVLQSIEVTTAPGFVIESVAAGVALTLVTAIDAGNVSQSLTTIDDAFATEPVITLTNRTDGGSWRHLLFALDDAEGKRPLFKADRTTRYTNSDPTDEYRPVWTQDFQTWNRAPSRQLVGGASGTIDWQFSEPFPAGRVYVATQPLGRQIDATYFAQSLLADYSSVCAPVSAASAQGVFFTSPPETDGTGRAVGEHPIYGLKLRFGGATNDGGPKRRLVMIAGIHAAGEATSWVPFVRSVMWMLDSASAEAVAMRSNWDVDLYFNITPNGLYGGANRRNFRSSVDPNRIWDNPNVEIAATQSAILSEIGGGRFDAFYSWHSWSSASSPLLAYVSTTQNNIETRSAVMQAAMDAATAVFGTSMTKNTSGSSNTDVWWAEQQGCAVAFDTEVQQNGSTDHAFYAAIGENWVKTLQSVDADGWFVETVAPTITAVTASNITQTGATITVTRSSPAAGTLYLALYPVGTTPTWSIGAGWSGTPVYTDADTDPGTGSTYQFVPDASGLPSGTQLVPWAVWYDGTTTVGPTQGTTFETLAAGAPVTVEPVAGRAEARGYAPALSQPITLTPAVGHASARGYATEVSQASSIRPEAGRALASGYAPTIGQPRTIAAQTGRAQASGNAPIIVQGAPVVINPQTGRVSARGYAPGVEQGGAVTVSPVAGREAARGYAPDIYTMPIGGYPSSVTITVPAGRLMSAASGRTITLRPR